METRSKKNKLVRRKVLKEISSDESEVDEKETEESEPVKSRHMAVAEDCVVSGRDVYTFKTPKRKGQMTEKASLSASSRKSEEDGSRSGMRYQDKSPSAIDTPQSVRRRIKKKLIQMTEVKNDEEGFSSETSSSSEDSIETTTPRMPRSGRSCKSPKTPLQKARAEDYFAAQDEKSKTSDNTLSNLRMSHLDARSVEEALRQHPQTHQKQCEKMLAAHQSRFSKWMYQMSKGFNLLLHGLGSKVTVVDHFKDYLLARDKTVLVVAGFFPAFTIKMILNAITEEIFGHVGEFPAAQNQMDFIAKSLLEDSGCDGHLYVLINNIDGPTLRNGKSQAVLCNLAQISGVHMLATIDHINAPLLWDQTRFVGFNWVWYDTTTYLPYLRETSYENSLLVRHSGSLMLTSVNHVFQSLTPNTKGIFMLIADFQLKHKDQTNYIGMAFQECYQKCREAFLVNSELTLRAQLTEFKDHKLLRLKKGADGAEYLRILLDAPTLEEFRKQQENRGS